ncbi:E3 SUMO-protein ligase pias4 [Saguinus oedipus]|uniref:E3 SUMO-protein ligase pias4 n=1 Tax=Saguinus oedipus TaxID=9490 RepID=A0ABQ9TQK2_SAGOE|nr:E3 SUMO-protein ligase pias4 [Saguinus oedipus]
MATLSTYACVYLQTCPGLRPRPCCRGRGREGRQHSWPSLVGEVKWAVAGCIQRGWCAVDWVGGVPPAQGSASLPLSSLLSKILSECEDADEIEYLVDGSWCPIRAEKERSCSPQGTILVLGPSDASGLLPTPSVNGSGALGSTGGGGPAGSVENGKPGADVVDLTLDSSSSSEDEEEEEEEEDDEDDEGPRPKRRCPFQKGLVPAC